LFFFPDFILTESLNFFLKNLINSLLALPFSGGAARLILIVLFSIALISVLELLGITLTFICLLWMDSFILPGVAKIS